MQKVCIFTPTQNSKLYKWKVTFTCMFTRNIPFLTDKPL